MRENFGEENEVPECDSDLEDEVRLLEGEIDERRDRIKMGIEHGVDEEVVGEGDVFSF